MNDQEQKQLLSAYFDNEVTPEERAKVEDLLESSIDARQTLEEISQLAEFIRSLPKEAAPETLASTVMQQAEREMSLPLPSVANNASPSATNSKPFWLVWGGGLLATVAMLFVATRLFHVNESENNYTELTAMAKKSYADVTDELVLGKEASSLQPVIKSEESFGPLASNELKDFKALSLSNNSTAMSRFKSKKGGEGFNRWARNLNEGKESKPSSPANFRDINWDEVQIGSVLIYNDKSGGQIAVVEVTVVDVQKGLETMQMLLARNDIPKMARNQKIGLQKKVRRGKTFFENNGKQSKSKQTWDATKENADRIITQEEQKTAPRHPALFVETSKTQLAATLTALQKRELFIDLQPQFAQVASVDVKNQSANLMFSLQPQLKDKETSQTEKKRRKEIRNKVPSKEESTDNAPHKKSDLQKLLKKDAKPFLVQRINSYQMLVQMEKPGRSISEKDQNDYYRHIKEILPSLSDNVKESNKKFNQAKGQKKRKVKKDDEEEDDKKTSSQKNSPHKLYSAIPQNGLAINPLRRLRVSQSVRVLFVFSKKKNRVNAASKAPRK